MAIVRGILGICAKTASASQEKPVKARRSCFCGRRRILGRTKFKGLKRALEGVRMANKDFSYAVICEGEGEIDMIFPHTSEKKVLKALKDYIIIDRWNGRGDSGIRVLRVRRKKENE